MIFVHIGRGKAGSSTIQRALEANAAALKTHGFAWPKAAEKTRFNYAALARELLRADWQDRVGELRTLAKSHDGDVVVSSEFLYPMGEERLRRLRETIGSNVTVIAYVRNYASWLRSSYVEGIRKAQRNQDFDAFFRGRIETASVRPALSRWIDAFGASAMRVRHVDDLGGIDLISDFGTAIGAELEPPGDRNRSPHWLIVEFMRALFECEHEAGRLHARGASVQGLVRAFGRTIKPLGVPDAQYCSAAQLRELDALYAEDCAWLEAMFGLAPPPATSYPERPFLPTLAAAPPAVRAAIRGKLPTTKPVQSDLYLAEVLDEVARRYP